MKGIAFNDATLWVDSPAITQEKQGYAVHFGAIQAGAAFSIEGFYGHRAFLGTGGVGEAVELRVSRAERDPANDRLLDLVLTSAVVYVKQLEKQQQQLVDANSRPSKLVTVESRTATFGTGPAGLFHVFPCDARANVSVTTYTPGVTATAIRVILHRTPTGGTTTIFRTIRTTIHSASRIVIHAVMARNPPASIWNCNCI
ncbi:hypothetical protein KI688_003584 [Linnemannia hyalina]|uniref:Uncharacterized protein n=1 Tax=Linnemannia hyalina TaxID=64524 RepID=A0A9P7XRJ0_9FUNG|nr:hypothetical protein KI688_003584 [Linnemannia hyalina]